MFHNLTIRWVIILSAVICSFWFIYPTYELYSIKNDAYLQDIDTTYLEEDALSLGLDLKGGLYITLELDHVTFLQSNINPKVISENKIIILRTIQSALEKSIKNNSDILDEFLQLSNTEDIKLLSYYSNLVRSNQAKTNDEIINLLKDMRQKSMVNIHYIMRQRIDNHNQYGVGAPSIQRLGTDRLVIELAGVTDVEKAKDYIQRTAEFQLTLVEDLDKFKEFIFTIDNSNNTTFKLQENLLPTRIGMFALESDFHIIQEIISGSQHIISDKKKIIWNNKTSLSPSGEYLREIYLVRSNPVISGGEVKEPKALISEVGNEDAGQWVVNLDMTKVGKAKWSRFTGNNIGKRVAIILDNEVFMAPTIQAKISSGGTRITGFSGKEEAENIAGILKAGELPIPIQVMQINYIGPSLGSDSINSGSQSMLIGMCLVFLFMILYYNLSGLIANIALLMNISIVLAVLVTMDAILTLPGIAGLLLTIGMTVDANIIIFERIREELKLGNTITSSIHNGYNRAFITILDANVTTLITAFILSFIGSGPIKGFATTLSVGIICSMFTAVFVTKTIFLTIDNYWDIKKLSI